MLALLLTLLPLPLAGSAHAADAPASLEAAPPGDELGPAKRAELAARAARWRDRKADAERMIRSFGAAPELDASERAAMVKRVRGAAADIETIETKVADIALEAIRGAESPSALRDARERAVRELLEARLLALWGNLVPRLLDDAVVEDGVSIGRRWAGPSWALSVGLPESAAYNRWQVAQAGFTPERYEAFGRRARETLGLVARRDAPAGSALE